MTSPNNIETIIYNMSEIQDELGQVQHPKWRKQGFDFKLAATEEVLEMMQHLKWHWWKNQDVTSEDIDWTAVYFETADVGNFILSHLLVTYNYDKVADMFVEAKKRFDNGVGVDNEPHVAPSLELTKKASHKLLGALGYDFMNYDDGIPFDYITLLEAMGLDFETLYAIYQAKAELNFFRWENGFKEGTYTRMWNGVKDDEYLKQIVSLMNPLDPNYRVFVRQALENVYAEVTKSKDTEPKQMAQKPVLNPRGTNFSRAPRPPHEIGHTPPDVA